MESIRIAREAGLPASLLARMEAARVATSDTCPVCGAGRGRFCADGIHADRIPSTVSPFTRRALDGMLPPKEYAR
jgi:hypothetical protein